MHDLLINGSKSADCTVVLAHGAGAAMDTDFMNAFAEGISAAGHRVVRFEFPYMAEKRRTGKKKAPNRAPQLRQAWLEVLEAVESTRIVIGGKSMGGRVASMIADVMHAAGKIAGLVCLGYPFHPMGKPDQLRTAHLANMTCPALIVQGTRDIMGTREEVAGYTLSPSIDMLWLEDGDHDLKPRKSVSGHTAAEHMLTMAAAVNAFAQRL